MSSEPVLGEPTSYWTVDLLRRRGRELSIGAAAIAFAIAVGSSERKGAMPVLRGLGLAALVGFGVKNLSELNEIIADTLLPQ